MGGFEMNASPSKASDLIQCGFIHETEQILVCMCVFSLKY
jgi:hypothetical protein